MSGITCTTLDLGDGITQSTDFADGRCEAVFLVDGDIAATAYVNERFEPCVDFAERLSVGQADFRRVVTVFGMAWITAVQLAAHVSADTSSRDQIGGSHA